MSYFGGGGGGWGQQGPPGPPHPFFNQFSQPPPGLPFFTTPEPQAYPATSIPPDFQQQGYPYVSAQVQVPPTVSATEAAASVTAPVMMMPQTERNLDTEQRRSDRRSPQGRYSPPRRYSPHQSSDRQDHRQSPERGRSYKDDDGDSKYARRMRRSPPDEQAYRRQLSEERGRPKERDRTSKPRDSPLHQATSGKPKVDIDALLQDERLRNVLFAGISKATAKLEQSLQEGNGGKDQPDLEGKSNLFPSASSSQRPRSILKRNKDGDEGVESKAFNNLSALERTLQMLRGKGDFASKPTSSERSITSDQPAQGALGQLAVYDEGNEEENYLYDIKEKSEANNDRQKGAAGSTQPFWSVPSKLETSKRELDSFDAKEKMFEEWRQSISRQSSNTKQSQMDMLRDVESVIENQSGLKKRDGQGGTEGDNQEELDSTVQNILQSIGFNFDLSRRMQELARKKKQQEDGGHIVNSSASFMNRGDIIAEELKATLLKSGSDLSGIDALIKEARASSKGSRQSSRALRSPSPVIRENTYGREARELSQSSSSRRELLEREEDERRSRERAHSNYKRDDQWDRVSPEDYTVPQRFTSPKRSYMERDSLSPTGNYEGHDRRSGSYEGREQRSGSYEGRDRRSGPRISERFRDDGERNEYFYPEKEFVDTPPSVPLLTSYSSRKKNEDLSSGLLKSMRVENFRVMSRSVNEYEDDDDYSETRRIILPAKSDRRKIPSHERDIVSPVRSVTRKRSASPLSVRISKERKVSPNLGSRKFEDYLRRSPDPYPQRESPVDHYSQAHRIGSRDRSLSPKQAAFDSSGVTSFERKRSPVRQRSPSPGHRRSRDRYREKSKSPYRRRSRSRNRSRSPREKSPLRRRRSPSPHRGRSSRSPRRKHFGKRTSPFSFGRRRSPLKKGGRSRSRERNKQGTAKSVSSNKKHGAVTTKSKQTKDLSKLSDGERKAELQKMLSEKGKSNETTVKAEGVKEPEPSLKKPDEGSTEKDPKWVKVADSMEGLSEMTIVKRAELIAKVKLLSADQQNKILTNLASRKAKVLSLKKDVERLKKAQNELMRKSQRSGLGNNDPQLKVNNLSQLEIEKEIDRLSIPDVDVAVTSNLEQTLATIQTTYIKNKDSSDTSKKIKADSKPEKQPPAKSISETPVKAKESLTSKTESESKKSKSEAGESSWTSVAVKEEVLPDIKDSKRRNDDKANEKKVDKKDKRSTTTSSISAKKKIYYEYIDSGNHWCSHCHCSCSALDQYLNHCHGKKHMQAITDIPKPWQSKVDRADKRKVGQAQTRRTKGSEMLFPIAGFFCTLCRDFCGDFKEAENHLKSDSHYDKYLDHLRDNPSYEKKLLLERTKSPKDKKNFDRQQNVDPKKKEEKPQPPPPPPPPPPPSPPSSKKPRKKVKSLRQKNEEDDKLAGIHDNTESVDMEIDGDDADERDDDVDVETKVPKLTGKSTTSVTSILNNLPESGGASSSVEMKSSQEDEIKSLGNFLTIVKEVDESKSKASKLPVITAKPELDLSNIPIPQPMEPSKIQHLGDIPIPPSGQTNTEEIAATVKTLQDVQDEEKKRMEEESRMEKIMMGIDVDADEEKPLAPVKPPPLLAKTSAQSENVKEVPKPKSIDSLFAKVSRSQKIKLQPKLVSEEKSELEIRIQNEVKEKLIREKQKLIQQQERKERRERMLEQKKMQKKKVISDSSSEEETESEEEEETPEAGNKGGDSEKDNLPKTGGQEENMSNLPVENVSSESENKAEPKDDSENFVTVSGDMNVDGNKPSEEGIALRVDENMEEGEEVGEIQKMEESTDTIDHPVIHPLSADNGSIVSEEIETEDYKADESMGDSSANLPTDFGTVVSKADVQQEIESQITDTNLTKVAGDASEQSNIAAEQSNSGNDKMSEEHFQSLPTPEISVNLSQDSANVTTITATTTNKKGKKPPARKTAIVRALQSESDLLGVLSISPESLAQQKTLAAKRLTPKRGGKTRRTTKKTLKAVSEEDDADMVFCMDDFVVLSEVTEEDEVAKSRVVDETVQQVEMVIENMETQDGAVPQEEEIIEKNNSMKNDPDDGNKRSEADNTLQDADVVMSSEVKDVDFDVSSTSSVNVDEKSSMSNDECKNETEKADEIEKIHPSTVAQGRVRRKGRGKTEVLPVKEEKVDENMRNNESAVDNIETVTSDIVENADAMVSKDDEKNSEILIQPEKTKDDEQNSEIFMQPEKTKDDEKNSEILMQREKTVAGEEDVDVADQTIRPVQRAARSAGRGRGKGRKVTAKREITNTPVATCADLSTGQSEQSNEVCVVNDGKESQSSTQTTETGDGNDSVKDTTMEEEIATQPFGRTRRSGRITAAKAASPVKKTTGRQTRSRGKKNATPVESEDNIDKVAEIAGTNESLNVRTLRSRETTNTNVAEMTEMQNTKEEIELEEASACLQAGAVREDADSDATITEDVDDPVSFDVTFQNETSDHSGATTRSQLPGETTCLNAEPAFIPTNQPPKDPPMSGVVSETENLDNVVMPMEEEESQLTANTSEFESSPTAGLSLGLDDDPESIDFAMAEVAGKPESQD